MILLYMLIFSYGCAVTKNTERDFYFPKQEIKVNMPPAKQEVWVFVMAGQSNMAGRGLVEPQDTISDSRIFTLNKNNEPIIAKEPLHYYEPTMTGLDCGMSFAKTLLNKVPANIKILMLPTAVGGSSIGQWLGDSVHRNVSLLTNFKDKVTAAKKYGIIKGIIWHQGESDTSPGKSVLYEQRLTSLIHKFRKITGNEHLPFVAGLLPGFQVYDKNNRIKNPGAITVNEALKNLKKQISFYSFVTLDDAEHRGDRLHLNSFSLRLMGKRYADEMYRLISK